MSERRYLASTLAFIAVIAALALPAPAAVIVVTAAFVVACGAFIARWHRKEVHHAYKRGYAWGQKAFREDGSHVLFRSDDFTYPD